MLVIFSVLLENSGLLKAGPRQAEFEPTPGKTYKFSDVHGVDEAKDVSIFMQSLRLGVNMACLAGASRSRYVPEGPDELHFAWWKAS